MSLIETWRGEIYLPALPERRMRVGENAVIQRPFLGAATSAGISQSQEDKNHQIIRTNLQPPFDQMLLRRKGAKRVRTPLPVLIAPEFSGAEIPEKMNLEWESLNDLETYADNPERVLENWVNKFSFRTEDQDAGLPGLRPPQIAALHAISAHFAIGTEFDPATIVLPTGTGKTETMLAAQVYLRPKRTLVMVPSVALRAQIGLKFATLGILPKAQVVPAEIARPRVAILRSGIRDVEEAGRLIEHANVIVALPNSLNASSPEALSFLVEQCTDLVVDEAHHISAATWASIRDFFKGKRVVQFTATPFRRDAKRVDGKIIFNFKLGDAQDAGYYCPINLRTVEEYGDENLRDRAIARVAIQALRTDLADGLNHVLMARADSKDRAEEIAKIYAELAPDLPSAFVYSGPGRTRENQETLDRLRDFGPTGIRIIVCVNMLGEGYDLPNLKVAALHDTHQSLAITLQFIGRFTRNGGTTNIGEATVVTNIADPKAEAKLAELYAEGADWDKIIKRLSEERIAEELRLQDVVEGLKEKGTLHEQLSLWNLRPRFSIQIYRTSCLEWDPALYKTGLRAKDESWYALDEKKGLLVAVVHRQETVDWGNYQTLEDSTYDLLLMWWDRQNGALFIYASDYNGLRTERLASIVTADNARLVSGTPIFQILNNVQLPLAKSLGSSRIGAISFTSYFGPNVTEGLATIEKSQAELNNIACIGYEDGERVLWGGAKRKGKIWQTKAGSISEWIEWCGRTWKKVSDETSTAPNITTDFLRPTLLEKPHDSYAIAVEWGEHAQTTYKDQSILFSDQEVPLYFVDLDVDAIQESGAIDIRISSGSLNSVYRLTISQEFSGGYQHQKLSGPDIRFKKANKDVVPLVEHLAIDPFIVRYADGSYSYNCYHIATKLDAGTFSASRLEAWDWSGVALNKESMGKSRATGTIQYRAFRELEAEFDLVFNDDGSGEAADLVGLKEIDETTIKLCLVHCKNAHDAKITRDIRNFYILCGQAQKSASIKHRGMNRLYNDLRRRHETWAREGQSRFLKGDMKKLAFFRDKSRRARLEFEVILVQPGASASSINDDALRLLATTELYLQKTAAAEFRVIVSP